jgi:hypothetical protein
MKDLFGYIKLGRLSKPIADKIGRKPADIYIHNHDIRHIKNKHGKELKLNNDAEILEYVKSIIKNCNLICEGHHSRLLLIYNQTKKLDVSVIELINFNSKLNIYQVKTANIRNKNFIKNKVVLWIK